MYERVRHLDAMNKWAEGTMKGYGSHLRRLLRFQDRFDVQVLHAPALIRPPNTPAISLGWAQLDYSCQPGADAGQNTTYGSIRATRSMASFYYSWDMHRSFAGRCMFDRNRALVTERSSPTDEMAYTLQNGGLARRIGESSRKSWALQWKHVKYIDEFLESQFQEQPFRRHDIAAAGTANVLAWMSSLRGGELFNLKRDDLEVVPPDQGEEYGLLPNLGFIGARLSPETKSSPNKTADIVVSYYSASGLSLGRWISRLLMFPSSDGTSLFSTPEERRWTSGYYMRHYLWPILEHMRVQTQEPTLRAFTDQPGNRIRDKVFSIHSYRRGATSYVKKKRPETVRAATREEQFQHARWNLRSVDIDQHYTEWSTQDRLAITLLCL